MFTTCKDNELEQHLSAHRSSRDSVLHVKEVISEQWLNDLTSDEHLEPVL